MREVVGNFRYNASGGSHGMGRKFLLQIDRNDYMAITLIADAANARIHACIVIRLSNAPCTGHHIRYRPCTSAFAVSLAYPQEKRNSRECHVELHGSTESSELNERIRMETSTRTRLHTKRYNLVYDL